MKVYPAKYTDKYGVEETTINNDGQILRMNLRGLEFTSLWFDDFEPEGNVSPDELKMFAVCKHGDLCECKIECEIPVLIRLEETDIDASLGVLIELGAAKETGGIETERVMLVLQYQSQEIRSRGVSGWFEDELLDIQRQLPPTHKLKCCFGCAYADYSPYGHGLFGGMICFKANKTDYLRVKTKDDYWPVLEGPTESVQEIFLCPEFEVRQPETGYRG